MTLRVLLIIVLMFAIAGCDTPAKKKANRKPPREDMHDQSGDVSFQAFVGRLQKAVALHDVQTLATMMTPNFGYRLEPPGEGEGVFQYWDQTNAWNELEQVLRTKFGPKDNFMVAPPQFATDPKYNGYRAGITWADGGWKFAYFAKD